MTFNEKLVKVLAESLGVEEEDLKLRSFTAYKTLQPMISRINDECDILRYRADTILENVSKEEVEEECPEERYRETIRYINAMNRAIVLLQKAMEQIGNADKHRANLVEED